MTEPRGDEGEVAGYNDLPAFVKAQYTPKEWLWLGPQGRARLQQELTEPDYDEP